MNIDVTLEMRSYIAHPFWPETNWCIDIEKKSGVNRQKSEEKRVAALKAECSNRGVTYEQYLEWKQLSKRAFYTRDDGTIYIPRHQVAGALVQAIGGAPKALRGPYTKDNFRSQVEMSDFETTLKKRSGVFARFVKLESSNQRSWQENEYIGMYLDEGEPFVATGKLWLADAKQVKVVKALLTTVVTEVGIGAARKMGFGRGQVTKFEEVK